MTGSLAADMLNKLVYSLLSQWIDFSWGLYALQKQQPLDVVGLLKDSILTKQQVDHVDYVLDPFSTLPCPHFLC